MRLRALLIIMCLAISLIPVGIIVGLGGFQIATASLGIIIVVTFFVSLLISYFISLPLEKLTKNIDEISKGNLDVQLEKSEIFEINNLTDSLKRVMTSLKLAIHKVGVKKGEVFEETIKARQEAEEKYENLLQNIDGWIWDFDEKGVCTSCSDNISKALGYKPDELIDKRIFDFIALSETKKLKQLLKNIKGEKQASTGKIELSCIHKDGHTVYILSNFTPIFDDSKEFQGFNGLGKDLTEIKAAEEKIEELKLKITATKERTRDILDSQQKSSDTYTFEDLLDESSKEFDYMFLFDEHANIIDCNPNMYKKLGYKKDEMCSLNLVDFDRLEKRRDIKKKLNQIKKQGSINLKTIHKKKNGSSIFVSENIQYLKDRNMFKCVVKEDSIA